MESVASHDDANPWFLASQIELVAESQLVFYNKLVKQFDANPLVDPYIEDSRPRQSGLADEMT
jgi:hypothetical protein